MRLVCSRSAQKQEKRKTYDIMASFDDMQDILWEISSEVLCGIEHQLCVSGEGIVTFEAQANEEVGGVRHCDILGGMVCADRANTPNHGVGYDRDIVSSGMEIGDKKIGKEVGKGEMPSGKDRGPHRDTGNTGIHGIRNLNYRLLLFRTKWTVLRQAP